MGEGKEGTGVVLGTRLLPAVCPYPQPLRHRGPREQMDLPTPFCSSNSAFTEQPLGTKNYARYRGHVDKRVTASALGRPALTQETSQGMF